MTRPAGKTAPDPTVSVAIEQHFPPARRIIDDDMAYRILPFTMRAVVRLVRPAVLRDWMIRSSEKLAPGIWGGLMCRKRYIDERLSESMGGLDAVVNLGAGFDTRLYRLPPASGVPAWEADLPENVATKRGRLRQLLGGVPPNVRLVAIDLEREKLGQILARHGYATGSRTLFIAEALTQYLHDQAIAELFGFLAEAATGSGLLFTYVLSSLIEGRAMYGQEALYQRYVAKRAIWLWGLDPEAVGSFLGGHGWRMLDHPDYAALAERYVRPTGRDLASTPIERIVYAQKV